MSDLARRTGIRLGLLDRSETIRRCGVELSVPEDGKKGVFLLYGTRLRDYDLVWQHLRRRYVIVLTHHWALLDFILRDYRRHSRHFDCVVSPNKETDRLLDFAPIFRSNSVDLLVDDQLWPRLGRHRDIEICDSVSVPWVLKRGLRWFEVVRQHLDRRGSGKAVYALKREPGPKEDAECHKQYDKFRTQMGLDSRFELRLGSEQKEMVDLYNRSRAIFHSSESEFGCRCILEAMYCGAWPIVEPYDWVRAASSNANIQNLVQIQNGVESIPDRELPEIRQWQTALELRSKLMEFLSKEHCINTQIKAFTLFSHIHIDSSSGKETSA